MDRDWISSFPDNPSGAFDDWEPFCQSEKGVRAYTRFVNEEPHLPESLQKARERLIRHVPDEHSLDDPDAPFNGPRYYLRSVVPEVRRMGEQPSCILEFGPSDYRTFLVTNGMTRDWAEKAGLSDEWESPVQWAGRHGERHDQVGFFENSFGVNVLLTALDSDGHRKALFRERGSRVAVHSGRTVGSADEGLRRRFGANLFDEKSWDNPAPDIIRAAYRAIEEEVGISRELTGGVQPILVSVGRVRSLCQPAALFYWPLNLSVGKVDYCMRVAQDKGLEFTKDHFVPFSWEGLVKFVLEQEAHAPVETWVLAVALYALGTQGVLEQEALPAHVCGESLPALGGDFRQTEDASVERTTERRKYLAELHQMLAKYFDEDDLCTVCFDLGVDYDDLPAKGKAHKARALVAYLEYRGRIPELVEMCERLRSHVSWKDILV